MNDNTMIDSKGMQVLVNNFKGIFIKEDFGGNGIFVNDLVHEYAVNGNDWESYLRRYT